MTESAICRHELPLAQCGVCSPRGQPVLVKPKVADKPAGKKQHPKVYSQIVVGEEGIKRATVELPGYRERFPALLRSMEADVSELLTSGRISQAISLSEQTRQHLNHTEFPMYFVGDLDARIVLVHLNPKQPDVDEDVHEGPHAFSSFEAYFDAHRHFGEYAYGRFATGRHYSRFDAKQVRFLRAFDAIEFQDDDSEEAKWTNLERVIDHKLQMELVPYGSDAFVAKGFTRRVLEPQLARLLSVIGTAPRDFVFFCGSAFEPVLEPFMVDMHEFFLPTAAGTDRQKSRFANLVIPSASGEIRAGLAHSWPRQGIPMTAYGLEVAARYNL
jgi:hypothetical protein